MNRPLTSASLVFAAALFAVAFFADMGLAEDADSKAKPLFNGEDFSGWTYVLNKEGVDMEDVWSIDDGVLTCKGRPTGYLLTKKNDYENYVLSLEWRWPEEGGNNGVLVHASTPRTLGIWPKSLEVQLHAGNAGDFWVIGTTIEVPNAEQRRKDRRHLNLTDDSEKPLGEWNRMEITCRGDVVEVKVNGDLVNRCTNSSVRKGAIALQSEGTPIQFRKIMLRELGE